MKKVRVALIGAGAMANSVHYPSLSGFRDVEMAGLCDIAEEKLIQTAKKFKIKKTYKDYRKMLDETKPDAVYILMPPHHLYDIVVHCLNRKLHVFVEKPPGITSAQTRSMAKLAKKNRCLTMAGFQRRFAPLIVEAKKRIDKKGPVIQCVAKFVKNYVGGKPYYDGATDILTCDAIHSVDILRSIGGEVKTLASDVGSFYADYDNTFNALMKFEKGATGILLTNWVAGKRVYAVEIYGKGIHAYVDPEKEALIYKDNNDKPEVISVNDMFKNAQPYQYAGFLHENRHFIDCIKKGKQPITNFADAAKTMELVDRIYDAQI